MFIDAHKHEDEWRLTNNWGHEMRLRCRPAGSERTIRIGTLGTRFEARINARTGNRTTVMARPLHSLKQPVLVVDTRRAGCGALGAWGPLEFASIIPSKIDNGMPYDFFHAPVLAPTAELLAEEKRGDLGGWRTFRDRYNSGLSDAAVAVARAFVEAAAARDGLAVFLCAEPYCADFAERPADEQDVCACHRFTLARRVANAITADHLNTTVERVDLDPAAFLTAFLNDEIYQPKVVQLIKRHG